VLLTGAPPKQANHSHRTVGVVVTQCNKERVNLRVVRRDMECCMHLVDQSAAKLIRFLDVSWRKFRECVHQWKDLNTREGAIATKAIQRFHLELVLVEEQLDVVPAGPDHSVGYHRACYMRFTDKTKIEREPRKDKNEKIKLKSVSTVY